jgi:magnesium transporter
MVGASFVMTVRLGPVGALGKVRTEFTSRPEFLAQGPLAAVHGIIDAIVDDYLVARSGPTPSPVRALVTTSPAA